MDNLHDSEVAASAKADSSKLSETTTIDFNEPGTLVGRVLDGRFFIEKNLTDGGADTGGIGVVYLAKDTKLMGKDVVVKILNENALKHPDIVRKFEHEKEALIRLDHPGIVRILDSGILNDGNPFMVMDYIRGHSLRKAIQLAGRLPLDVAANVIESVTDALTAAHSEKVLHRDIKPENIMLTPIEEGLYRVRLIDFGIARVGESKLAPETEISRAIGSILYIAPEQLIGRLDLTPAADIFSTAIVAYEILTGEVPFKPVALAEMYQLEKDGVITPPTALRPDMPREAERILLSALEFDPEKRPQNARAFGRYLAHELRSDGRETDRFFASIKTEFHSSPTQSMELEHAIEFDTIKRIEATSPVDKLLRAAKFVLPVAIVLALIGITGAYFAWNSAAPSPPAAQPSANSLPNDLGPERKFAYYLMVQKMRNGKPFEAPYRSTGQATVERDYQTIMTFVPESEGYMYVFNQGKNKNGNLEYSLLSPTPLRNNGVSKVAAGQTVEVAGNVSGERGTEINWMIWAKESVPELENIVKIAFATQTGIVNPAGGQTLRAFLEKNQKEIPAIEKDAVNLQSIIRARGDEVVHRFELEHQ